MILYLVYKGKQGKETNQKQQDLYRHETELDRVWKVLQQGDANVARRSQA